MSKPSIITRKLTDLKPDLKNANKGTERGLRMLDDSLSEDGAGRGILLDRNNNVIAGNKTLERAVDQGFTEIVIVPTDGKQLVATQRIDVDIDSVQGRRMALRDNRVGQVDLEFDGDVLRELADEGVDLSALWTEDELAELIGEDVTGATDPGAQVDKAEELQAKWQVKPGDLWTIGKHRLLCGDSTKAEDVARVMGGEKFRLMWTDPPYGVSYADKNRFLNAVWPANRVEEPIENDHMSEADTEAMLTSVFSVVYQFGTAGASFYVASPPGTLLPHFINAINTSGFQYKHQLIWVKNQFVMGRADYHYRHESILYGWKKDGGHYFVNDHTLDSVFEIDKPRDSNEHPTMKPVELVVPMINNSSKSGELVIDPFCGSGTTLVACEQTHRIGRGIEIEPKYCAVTLERLSLMGLEAKRG